MLARLRRRREDRRVRQLPVPVAEWEAAVTNAGELFDQGDIWQDSAEVPLLHDDFGEQGDAGFPLEFTVEDEVCGDWPEPDASVKASRRRNAAFQAVRLLIIDLDEVFGPSTRSHFHAPPRAGRTCLRQGMVSLGVPAMYKRYTHKSEI